MSSLAFNNIFGKLAQEVDVIIYYNKHVADKGLDICKDLDDFFSVLIDGRIIDRDDVEQEIIEYYKSHFESLNPEVINQLINDRIREFSTDLNP